MINRHNLLILEIIEIREILSRYLTPMNDNTATSEKQLFTIDACPVDNSKI